MEQQRQINIDPVKDGQQMICKECGGKVFDSALLLYKISAVLMGQETIAPIQVFICKNCGTIVEELLPENVIK